MNQRTESRLMFDSPSAYEWFDWGRKRSLLLLEFVRWKSYIVDFCGGDASGCIYC